MKALSTAGTIGLSFVVAFIIFAFITLSSAENIVNPGIQNPIACTWAGGVWRAGQCFVQAPTAGPVSGGSTQPDYDSGNPVPPPTPGEQVPTVFTQDPEPDPPKPEPTPEPEKPQAECSKTTSLPIKDVTGFTREFIDGIFADGTEIQIIIRRVK